jgi:hypothetical protein
MTSVFPKKSTRYHSVGSSGHSSTPSLNLRVLGSIPRRLTILRFAQSGFVASNPAKLASPFGLAKHGRFRGGSPLSLKHFADLEILSRAAQCLDSQTDSQSLPMRRSSVSPPPAEGLARRGSRCRGSGNDRSAAKVSDLIALSRRRLTRLASGQTFIEGIATESQVGSVILGGLDANHGQGQVVQQCEGLESGHGLDRMGAR